MDLGVLRNQRRKIGLNVALHIHLVMLQENLSCTREH